MEVHKPQITKKTTLNGTLINKIGIVTVTVAGIRMASKIKNNPAEETVKSIVLLEIFDPNKPPNNRPTNINNQYTPTILPATVASIPKPGLADPA